MRLIAVQVLFCCMYTIVADISPLEFNSLQWDEIEQQVKKNVRESASDLLEQAQLVQNIAKTHIGVTIRANAFEALKVVVNNAVKKSKKSPTRRGSRQEDEDEAPESDEEDPKPTQAELQNAVKINENVFSFIGQTVKEVVSGITGTPVSALGGTTGEGAAIATGITGNRKRPALNYRHPYRSSKPRSENITYGEDFFEKNEKLFRQMATEAKGKPYSDQFMKIVDILATNSETRKNSTTPGTVYIKDSVEEILRYQPWLLPDLYKGAGELKGYLYTVEKLVDELNVKLSEGQ